MNAVLEKHVGALAIGIAFLGGLVLRIQQLGQQAFVDDEWHTLSFVLDRPLGWVLTHFSMPSGFTSIPLNLYAWCLQQSGVWSELLLRVPSLVLGLLCIVLGPLWAAPIIGRRAAGLFALLLSVSPLLVFYSRLARPYSAVACLGFLSIIAAAQWLYGGRLRDGIAYAVCGLFAVYWHPFAAIAIGTMGGSVLLASITQAVRSKHDATSRPVLSWKQVLGVLVGMALAGAAMMLPALLESFQNSMDDVAQQGTTQFSSWARAVALFCGSSNAGLVVLVLGLALIGLSRLMRVQPWLAITIVILFPLQSLALVAMGPHSSHVGIVLARYSIVLLPVVLMLVAYGFQGVMEAWATRATFSARVPAVVAACYVLVLLLTGPLPRTWATPNNFTNHGVFQHDYSPIDWSHSFVSEFTPKGFALRTSIRTDELSGFYGFLREHQNGRPVVEYPMMVGDHFNPHYYPQWYHQRPVLAGYAVGLVPPTPLGGGGVFGNTYVDDVLNLVDDPELLQFRCHISMTDFESMRTRGVEYIIVHKRFEAELSRVAPPPSALNLLLAQYKARCQPVFEDAFIAVFSLDAESALMPPRPNPSGDAS